MKLSDLAFVVLRTVRQEQRDNVEADLQTWSPKKYALWAETVRKIMDDNEGVSPEDAGFVAWHYTGNWTF